MEQAREQKRKENARQKAKSQNLKTSGIGPLLTVDVEKRVGEHYVPPYKGLKSPRGQEEKHHGAKVAECR